MNLKSKKREEPAQKARVLFEELDALLRDVLFKDIDENESGLFTKISIACGLPRIYEARRCARHSEELMKKTSSWSVKTTNKKALGIG